MEILVSLTPNASEPRSFTFHPASASERDEIMDAIAKALRCDTPLDVHVGDGRRVLINPAHIVYVEVPD